MFFAGLLDLRGVYVLSAVGGKGLSDNAVIRIQ